ncbi:MAG: type II toxin-antitoxin system CcdA family antitoxin [Methylococcaceae bacterium]|nr:type II toxin-antitoxin system CcdA family antitoxin [Methylococcaceae bacterium]
MSSPSFPKEAADLLVDAECWREAKPLGINRSPAFEAHLAERVKAGKREKWRDENREAVEAYNRRVEEHGVFSDGWRSF